MARIPPCFFFAEVIGHWFLAFTLVALRFGGPVHGSPTLICPLCEVCDDSLKTARASVKLDSGGCRIWFQRGKEGKRYESYTIQTCPVNASREIVAKELIKDLCSHFIPQRPSALFSKRRFQLRLPELPQCPLPPCLGSGTCYLASTSKFNK